MNDKVIQRIASILAIGVKIAIFVVLYKVVLHYYNPKANFHSQHIVIWILLYFPYAVGVERIIKSIGSSLK